MPEILLAILLIEVLTDNRKGVYYLYQTRTIQKNKKQPRQVSYAENNTPLIICKYEPSEIVILNTNLE